MAEARQRSISMTDEDWGLLKVKAEARNLSVSDLVRHAVESYGVTADMSVTGTGEPSEPTWTLTDEQRAETAATVIKDSVSVHCGEPFAVARTHVPDCLGMVLYWRDQGRWQCRKCGQELSVTAPGKLPTSGSVVAKTA